MIPVFFALPKVCRQQFACQRHNHQKQARREGVGNWNVKLPVTSLKRTMDWRAQHRNLVFKITVVSLWAGGLSWKMIKIHFESADQKQKLLTKPPRPILAHFQGYIQIMARARQVEKKQKDNKLPRIRRGKVSQWDCPAWWNIFFLVNWTESQQKGKSRNPSQGLDWIFVYIWLFWNFLIMYHFRFLMILMRFWCNSYLCF